MWHPNREQTRTLMQREVKRRARVAELRAEVDKRCAANVARAAENAAGASERSRLQAASAHLQVIDHCRDYASVNRSELVSSSFSVLRTMAWLPIEPTIVARHVCEQLPLCTDWLLRGSTK